MAKKDASRFERCHLLCMINSIREDNFIEDSFRSKVLAESPAEDDTRKMFASLEPCEFSIESHLEAINKLWYHFRGVFINPRAIYLNQYLHNMKLRDMRKIEQSYSQDKKASGTVEHLVKAADTPPNKGDPLIESAMDSKVDKAKKDMHQSNLDAQSQVLASLKSLEAKFDAANAKRLEAEAEVQRLKQNAAQAKKEAAPASTPGANEVIELDGDSPLRTKQVRYNLPPKSKLNNEPRGVKNPYAKKQPTDRVNQRNKKRGPHQDRSPAGDAVPDSSLNYEAERQGGQNGHQNKRRKRKKKDHKRPRYTQQP